MRAGERANALAGIEGPEALRGMEVTFQSVSASTAVHCSAQTDTGMDLCLPKQVEVNQQKPMPNLDFFCFSLPALSFDIWETNPRYSQTR